jgi:hypothetical protein
MWLVAIHAAFSPIHITLEEMNIRSCDYRQTCDRKSDWRQMQCRYHQWTTSSASHYSHELVRTSARKRALTTSSVTVCMKRWKWPTARDVTCEVQDNEVPQWKKKGKAKLLYCKTKKHTANARRTSGSMHAYGLLQWQEQMILNHSASWEKTLHSSVR